MLARDLMTTDVVSVSPDLPVGEVARLLLERSVSAAPVVDAAGTVVGMVSEGDLIGRDEADREARRDWWLNLLAEGEPLHPDFLNSLRDRGRTARDVMAAPVISVAETAEAAEIAHMLRSYRIKRVPVLCDGRLVGIVSRADLLRAVAEVPPPARPEHRGSGHGVIGGIITAIEDGFARGEPAPPPAAAPQPAVESDPTAAGFRDLAAAAEHRKAERAVEARRAAAQRVQEQVKQLIDLHVADEDWRAILHRAGAAAEQGDKELLLLRFPSGLCTDGGRAVNAPLPDWPQTLRGEAAEIYLRWERDLKPRGFPLVARVLDFPGGKPGDIGLFLVWGD